MLYGFQHLVLDIAGSFRYAFYFLQVPVRVAGGLLFELLGQSVGDPFVEEDDVPIVLRSWQAQNFLVTVLHLKGSTSRINVLGITEVQVSVHTGLDSLSGLTCFDKLHLTYFDCCYYMVFVHVLHFYFLSCSH